MLAADGIATPSGRTVHTLHGVCPVPRLCVDDSPLVAHLVPLLVGSVQDLGGEVDDRLDEFHVVVLGLQVDPLGERDEACGRSVLKFNFIHFRKYASRNSFSVKPGKRTGSVFGFNFSVLNAQHDGEHPVGMEELAEDVGGVLVEEVEEDGGEENDLEPALVDVLLHRRRNHVSGQILQGQMTQPAERREGGNI